MAGRIGDEVQMESSDTQLFSHRHKHFSTPPSFTARLFKVLCLLLLSLILVGGITFALVHFLSPRPDQFAISVKKWFAGEVLDAGFLASKRRYRIFLVNNTDLNWEKNTKNYRESWGICEKSGGRLAWLDTEEVHNKFTIAHGKLARRIEEISENFKCVKEDYWVGALALGRGKSEWVWVWGAEEGERASVPFQKSWPDYTAYRWRNVRNQKGVFIGAWKGRTYMKFGNLHRAVKFCRFLCEYKEL